MRHRRSTTIRRARRGRGSIHVLVLGVALMVTVIGLSALAAMRVRHRAVRLSGGATKASVAAQSAVEIALERLGNAPYWRSNMLPDTWSPDETWINATVSCKIVDELDGILADDPLDPVRLYCQATVGDAVRLISVRLDPYGSPNLLKNPGLEEGTTDWTGAGLCDLQLDVSQTHGGQGCVWVKNRATSDAGPAQDVTDVVRHRGVYQTEVWVKMQTGAAETIRVCLILQTTQGGYFYSFDRSGVENTWAKVTGTFTARWAGSLQNAYWQVRTSSGTQSFFVDDAVLVGPMVPAPGTWRREVLP